MMDESRSEEAQVIHEEIIQNEEIRRRLLAENAQKLAFIYENELYKNLLGDEEGQWAGYLSEIRIFYSRNQVDSFLRVYNKMTVKLGVPPQVWVEVPITRLTDVLPVITAEDYEDWLIKAKTLTTQDWNIEVRKAKGLLTEEEHEVHNYRYYKTCTKCGKKELLDKSHVHD